jgi:hypothetical protein
LAFASIGGSALRIVKYWPMPEKGVKNAFVNSAARPYFCGLIFRGIPWIIEFFTLSTDNYGGH